VSWPVVAGASDLVFWIVLVLMVVGAIIELPAVTPHAGALFAKCTRALAPAQSGEGNVGRHVHTCQRSQRQRLGAVMCAAGEEQTGESDRGETERPSEEWQK
jgi:hypothetical protein